MELPDLSLSLNELQLTLGLWRWRPWQLIWDFHSCLLWRDIYFANDIERKCLSKWKEKRIGGECSRLLLCSFASNFFECSEWKIFWRSQLFVWKAERWFGVVIFRWCYQFLCYQVLHVGYERPGEVWFIMFLLRAFTTVIVCNLLLNLVLCDARGVLGDKRWKHSLHKWMLAAVRGLSSVRKDFRWDEVWLSPEGAGF